MEGGEGKTGNANGGYKGDRKEREEERWQMCDVRKVVITNSQGKRGMGDVWSMEQLDVKNIHHKAHTSSLLPSIYTVVTPTLKAKSEKRSAQNTYLLEKNFGGHLLLHKL